MLGALRGSFDGEPAVSGAVGNPAGRGIMAFLDARLRGDFADAVMKADPTKLRLVPPSQHRTTD